MATRPKSWPTHGNAVDARDRTAEALTEILMQAETLIEIVGNGEFTRAELLYRAAQVQKQAAKGLRLLEAQGAPTQPHEEMP